jgi:hypothetical protein
VRRAFFAALLVLALPLAAGEIVTANDASCDIGLYPAATLLLPYFEVDFNAPVTTAVNTVFTITNTSKQPQIARVTIWTDYGYPASWFDVFLTGYDAQAVSLYEIIARGRYPITNADLPAGSASAPNGSNPNLVPKLFCRPFGGIVPGPTLERLQRALTTGERDEPGCPVGGRHTHATGYVTVDVINSCAIDSPLEATYWTEALLFDNVLTGEYVRINPDPDSGNYAGSNPMVHIRAVPAGGPAGTLVPVALPYTFYDRYTPAAAKKLDRRQPLPSSFGARFIEGGPTGFTTNYTLWREGVTGSTKSQCDYGANRSVPIAGASVVRFDEHENATANAAAIGTALAAQIPTSSSLFPPVSAAGDRGGWMWFSLDNGAYAPKRASQNWIVVQMQAEGRYAVDLDATTLANGCTLIPPSAP